METTVTNKVDFAFFALF